MNSFWSGLSSFSPISMVIFKGKVMEDVFYLLGLEAFCESKSKSAGCAKNWHSQSSQESWKLPGLVGDQ